MQRWSPRKWKAEGGVGERLVRRTEAMARLGIGRTMFDEQFVRTKRLKFFKLGPRAVACRESDLLKLIDEMAGGDAA